MGFVVQPPAESAPERPGRDRGTPSAAGDAGRIAGLAAMARALGRSANLTTMVERAAEEARVALGAASVSISRLQAGTRAVRTLINVGALGPEEERWPEQEVYRPEEYGLLATVLDDLLPWTADVEDPACDPQEVALLRSLDKASSLGTPILVDGSVWGELYATRRVGEAAFSEADIGYAEVLAAILAGAVSRALREEALEQLAYRDSLTGLANRRALDEAVERAVADAASTPGQTVSVVMVDVDGLKSVNDSFGHDEGDRLLRAVAGLLVRHLGVLPGSLAARIGGDEFAALVPRHPVDKVVRAAGDLCEAALSLPHGAGLSCGIARTLPRGRPMSVADLFRAADAALYLAKRSGSSSAVLATSPHEADDETHPSITDRSVTG